MQSRYFGEIPGYPVGTNFKSRKDLSIAQVHKPTQAGISGSGNEGADSIVLSGGYSDIDNGDKITYTGYGGINGKTQISNQKLIRQNKALALNRDNGHPVRVIRGFKSKSKYAPVTGYRYDGLYLVTDYWKENVGGYSVCKYFLIKAPDNVFNSSETDEYDVVVSRDEDVPTPTRRSQVISLRIVRDTVESNKVKKLYDYSCQVCGVKLEGKNGPYAEGAHIKPLGIPHNGPDISSNILCLCPNHHVLFDIGAFAISQNFKLIGLTGTLIVKSKHRIDSECLLYREMYNTKNNMA